MQKQNSNSSTNNTVQPVRFDRNNRFDPNEFKPKIQVKKNQLYQQPHLFDTADESQNSDVQMLNKALKEKVNAWGNIETC